MMYPYINLEKTGKQIQKYMDENGYRVQDVDDLFSNDKCIKLFYNGT